MEEVKYRFQSAGAHIFDDKFNDPIFVANMMVPDIGRARLWTSILAGQANKDLDKSYNRSRRPALF
jgi:hypothetical protein